ncbi:hypothetical protein VTN77DRAFT_7757 [Rasamsonia byssochlamydoides]|uniref:uncharacterized protein n=1 Tax=Rasamsonia byssochlamydoides TaxID=89139 RepID=UPI0037446EE2
MESLNQPVFRSNCHSFEVVPLSEFSSISPAFPRGHQAWTSNGEQGQQHWFCEEWTVFPNYQLDEKQDTVESPLFRDPDEGLASQSTTKDLHPGSWRLEMPETSVQHGPTVAGSATPSDCSFEEACPFPSQLVKFHSSPNLNRQITNRSCTETDLPMERTESVPTDADQHDDWMEDCLVEYPRDAGYDDSHIAIRQSGLPMLTREDTPQSSLRSSHSPLPLTVYTSEPIHIPSGQEQSLVSLLWSQDNNTDSGSDALSNRSSSVGTPATTTSSPTTANTHLPHRSEKRETSTGTRHRAKASKASKAPNKLPPRSDARDAFLIECKRRGMSYKEIKKIGRFEEAESTLRGRFRTLTKSKEQRVRKPKWQAGDIELLCEAVRTVCSETSSKRSSGRPPLPPLPPPHHPTVGGAEKDEEAFQLRLNLIPKISWKRVAEYIWHKGGSYHFGNATCKKKWCEIHGIAV